MEKVIAYNRTLFKRAQELNLRAGREVFPIPTQSELAEVLQSLLGNVARLADIRMPDMYRLPALDEHAVAQVLAESPDTISILGRTVAVEYRQGYAPRVRLDFRGEQAREWLQLPDDGIRLPGGREVAMCSALEEGGYFVEVLSSQFKAKARECLNQGLWEKWQKPELPAPTESIAPVAEKEYGRCVVTDASLIAYGAVNYDSWYGSWKSHWTRDRAEAEQVHAQACAKFVEVREKAARDALRNRIGSLNNAHYYNNELTQELRTLLYHTYYGYSGGASTVAEMEALIAEVEAAVVAVAKRKAEAERAKREAEAEEQQRALEGERRIQALNQLRAKIGWSPIGIWGGYFENNGGMKKISDHHAISQAEAEVRAEEARLEAEARRDAEMRSRQASESSLAALAQKFAKPTTRR